MYREHSHMISGYSVTIIVSHIDTYMQQVLQISWNINKKAATLLKMSECLKQLREKLNDELSDV